MGIKYSKWSEEEDRAMLQAVMDGKDVFTIAREWQLTPRSPSALIQRHSMIQKILSNEAISQNPPTVATAEKIRRVYYKMTTPASKEGKKTNNIETLQAAVDMILGVIKKMGGTNGN